MILALLSQCPDSAPENPDPPDVRVYDYNDPKVAELPDKHLFILISDQNDFETEFVKETFIIPNDILSGKILSKFPGHLEQWLKARRELPYYVIRDPSVVGPPLIKYKRNERPYVLPYPYKQVPHHVIFLKHLKYLYELSKMNDPNQIVRTTTLSIELKRTEVYKHNTHKILLGVESITIPVSPLIAYRNYTYITIDGELVFSDGPTIREQFPLLDAGTGFLLNDSNSKTNSY